MGWLADIPSRTETELTPGLPVHQVSDATRSSDTPGSQDETANGPLPFGAAGQSGSAPTCRSSTIDAGALASFNRNVGEYLASVILNDRSPPITIPDSHSLVPSSTSAAPSMSRR